jgi:hypothetical protein
MTIAQTTQTKFNTRGGLRTTKTTVHAHRIHGRNRLQKFIPNGRFLRSVGYDYNIEIILDMLKSNDWENATIIVGYRLSGKNCEPHVITDLMKEILCGRLKLRVPLKGEFHEKFFLANGDTADGIEFFTDVNGSPNPTMTGSAKRGQQSNRITEITIFGNYLQDPYYKETESQWDWYMSNSEAFDGELVELLDAREDEEWIPVIKRYYEGDPSVFEESTLTPIEVLTLSAGEEMLRNSAKGVMVTQLDLPEIPADAIQSFIEDIGSIGFEARSTNSGQIELPTSLIDSARYSSEHIPWMQIIDGDLLLRIEGETISRRNPNLSQVEEIKNELHRFEEFIDSTDNSHRPGLKSKMALSEFLLSGMCAPFDYLWMAQRRTKFNRVREGPQMTSYLGGSGNGKSFASRYLLKMISGRDLEPLPSKQFTEKRVRSCARNGSIMPLIFDDLKRIRIREWDKWGKTLWDRGYVFDKPHAQLIVTANDPIDSAGPLGRRVREIRMEATFENNGENTEIVETCLKECSQIFPYFSEVVLRMHESGSAPYEHNDPLKIGRLAIEELYKIANLEAPEWWCPLPFEECVDINAYHWYDILHKELFKIERRLDSFRIPVNEGTHEINERLKSFPAHLQAKKAGKSIHIENADGFIAWISKVQHLYENDKGRSSRKMRHLLSKGKWPRF